MTSHSFPHLNICFEHLICASWCLSYVVKNDWANWFWGMGHVIFLHTQTFQLNKTNRQNCTALHITSSPFSLTHIMTNTGSLHYIWGNAFFYADSLSLESLTHKCHDLNPVLVTAHLYFSSGLESELEEILKNCKKKLYFAWILHK